VNTTSFFYTTRRGKFIEWDRILDRTHLRGDEMVLDMGCGRGAVLTAVACRLTTGRVTGVDIWSTTDQSGNAMDGALQRVVGRGQRSPRLPTFSTADQRRAIECAAIVYRQHPASGPLPIQIQSINSAW